MNTTSQPARPEVIARRSTVDGKAVYLYSDGDVTNQLGITWTRHAALPLPLAWEVMEAVGLFDVAEIPALVTAAAKAKRGAPLGFWGLVDAACRESHRAGTRPPWAPKPAVVVTRAALEHAASGNLVDHVRRGCRKIRCKVCG